MEGYLQLAAEAVAGLDTPPSHILLQAGVGGLAGAVAAHARQVWGDAPRIVVVEPDAAPALMESVRAGRAGHRIPGAGGAFASGNDQGRPRCAVADKPGGCVLCHRISDTVLGKPGAALVCGGAGVRSACGGYSGHRGRVDGPVLDQ